MAKKSTPPPPPVFPGGPPPGYSTGLVQRLYSAYPGGYLPFAPVAPEDWLIPEADQERLLAEQKAARASLWYLREDNYDLLKSLDQDGLGLCWAFSTTKSVMYALVRMNVLKARLSAWWVAGKVVNWRDQGYWGSASLQQIRDGGVPLESLCPKYSRQYDTAEVAADAAKRKVIEWYDGTEDRARNKQIMISAFLRGEAPVLDYNHLSHSMCGCYLDSINPLVVYCDNSWNDIAQYGPKGTYKLTGNYAIPDGIVVPRVAQPAP